MKTGCVVTCAVLGEAVLKKQPQLERLVRRVVPSATLLTHGVPGRLLDLTDPLFRISIADIQGLPPPRFRLRTGIGNRILRNHVMFIVFGYDQWNALQASGFVNASSDILDIGSGCGRLAMPIARIDGFRGTYTGIDVDAEMVEWCRGRFRDPRFTFHHADVYSSIYNPDGSREPYVIPVADESMDFVMSYSLFTHILEPELVQYTEEASRVLRPGGTMMMTVFCLEDVQLGGRWTFSHRVGRSYLESELYPHAAVAYERAHLHEISEQAGFTDVRIEPSAVQSRLVGRK